MDTVFFEPVAVEEVKIDDWQTQEDIKQDALWCAQRLRARNQFPVAGSENSILESALGWALV